MTLHVYNYGCGEQSVQDDGERAGEIRTAHSHAHNIQCEHNIILRVIMCTTMAGMMFRHSFVFSVEQSTRCKYG